MKALPPVENLRCQFVRLPAFGRHGVEAVFEHPQTCVCVCVVCECARQINYCSFPFDSLVQIHATLALVRMGRCLRLQKGARKIRKMHFRRIAHERSGEIIWIIICAISPFIIIKRLETSGTAADKIKSTFRNFHMKSISRTSEQCEFGVLYSMELCRERMMHRFLFVYDYWDARTIWDSRSKFPSNGTAFRQMKNRWKIVCCRLTPLLVMRFKWCSGMRAPVRRVD